MSNSEKLCQLCQESPEDLIAYSEVHRVMAGLTPVLVMSEVAVLHSADGGAGVVLRRGDGAGRSTVFQSYKSDCFIGKSPRFNKLRREIGRASCRERV